MAPEFGTSGLRGLARALTDPLCAGHVRAFLDGRATDGTLLIGRDLRASSPRIAAAVAGAARAAGLEPRDCGVLPTPALALAAMTRGTAAVMVTGSHIPANRNGLKFYTAEGEITKADEAAIRAGHAPFGVAPARADPDPAPRAAYRDRYHAAFAPDALAGLRIGVYEHSSAARDMLAPLLAALGATVLPLGRADRFVAVDTEALGAELRAALAGWTRAHALDAVVSTDGDADRPLVADAAGRVIPGDRLGPLTADWAGAETVVTPVSSNTLVEAMGRFAVIRTRIGSPHVIAGMAGASGRVAGYEANGGFLLGFRAEREGRALAPLPTRDALLPILAPLVLARARDATLAELDAALPRRFTATDRLTGIAPARGRALLARIDAAPALAARLFGPEPAVAVDRTDGWRGRFPDGTIRHLRPSGNAPEFRAYVEADSAAAADRALSVLLERLPDCLAP